MKAIYSQTVALRDTAPAAICALFQETASQHQTELGVGREEMCRRRLLWMITRQKLIFYRSPAGGEDVTVSTWLSEARHGMYLRQYELTDVDGVLCRAAAVWTLVDAERRTLSSLPLAVPLYQSEVQLPRFSLLCPVETTQEVSFTVPQEFIDKNGHMNNARYFDAVAQILPKNSVLHAAQVDYHREARQGETLVIGSAASEDSLLIQAQGDRGLCFRMKLDYK